MTAPAASTNANTELTVTRTASCRATAPIDATTGEALSQEVFTQRVGWAAALTAQLASKVVKRRWNRAGVSAMAANTLPDGRRAPSFAYKHAAALWGWPAVPTGTSSRVKWMALEVAGRQLRSAGYRMGVVDQLLAGASDNDCGDQVSARNLRRRIGRHLREAGVLPRSLFDLEAPPPAPVLLPLAATDDQYATLTHAPGDPSATITVLLPTRARPTHREHWSWVRFTVPVPQRYRDGRLRPPTLRLVDAGTPHVRVAVDLPVEYRVPAGVDNGVALGVDWGVNRLLTGTIGRRATLDGVQQTVVDGHPLFFDASGLLAKTARLRVERERICTKLDHQHRLTASRAAQGLPPLPGLAASITALEVELARVNARQRNLADQVARLAGRWVVEQALAAGAGSIVLEDLATLEHRGLGKRLNNRVSAALRGRVADAIGDAASLAGLRVLIVSAPGTSKNCPRCTQKLVHRTHPGGPAGYAWASCRCGLSADRDHAAAENITRRGLTPARAQRAQRVRRRRVKKTKLVPPRSRGTARTPGKGRPTPPRPRTQWGIKFSGSGASCPTTQTPTTTSSGAGVGHRSSAADTRTPVVSGNQVRTKVPHYTSTTSPVLAGGGVEGLRYAYRHHLTASPVLYRAPLRGEMPTATVKKQ